MDRAVYRQRGLSSVQPECRRPSLHPEGNGKRLSGQPGLDGGKIGWYSNTDQASALPLYRAYNPNAKTGAHNFTVSAAEQKFLTENGWKGEGVAWYGVKLRK
ncbi:hypothetical protein [Allobaculum sp. Allo2]|uniref:hypothetical protein n=1 Tax=Allobaculum sp. Allo2 TaxID=2853432 RepID=UPI003462D2A0